MQSEARRGENSFRASAFFTRSIRIENKDDLFTLQRLYFSVVLYSDVIYRCSPSSPSSSSLFRRKWSSRWWSTLHSSSLERSLMFSPSSSLVLLVIYRSLIISNCEQETPRRSSQLQWRKSILDKRTDTKHDAQHFLLLSFSSQSYPSDIPFVLIDEFRKRRQIGPTSKFDPFRPSLPADLHVEQTAATAAPAAARTWEVRRFVFSNFTRHI